MPKRFTITAALPYTNGPIHIGHLAGVYIPADIYSRYLRLKNKDVVFVCGSDEHGVAIALKAKKEGKKTFTSTRDDKKKGKLEYSTKTAAEVKAAKKRMSDRERARVGDTSKQLSEKGAAFKLARKMGKKEFTHKGKKYTTLLKGEKPNKILPELSGKTSKKIKKFVGA